MRCLQWCSMSLPVLASPLRGEFGSLKTVVQSLLADPVVRSSPNTTELLSANITVNASSVANITFSQNDPLSTLSSTIHMHTLLAHSLSLITQHVTSNRQSS